MKNTHLSNELEQYAKEVAEQVVTSDFETLAAIIEELVEAKNRGNRIFTAGNGGSAATASHMANDFTKGVRVHGRNGFNIECLADSLPVVTCLANDFSYNDIFTIQLRTKAKRGDVLVVFSGSGNSPNIVNAVQLANEMGLVTIGFGGMGGGRLAGLCRHLLVAPTNSMEQLEDMHMLYEHAMVCSLQKLLKDQWGIEIIRYPNPAHAVSAALFDFDGTISLIREGWQEIMIPYFIEVLAATPACEPQEEIRDIVCRFVDTLTGKQTIFQCIRLDEEVVKRGGAKTDPYLYKAEYLRRLSLHIENRHKELEAGGDPEKYLVPGSRALLKALQASGIRCYLASGTDEEDVLQEARLLQIDGCFDGGIYGAKDGVMDCSKELVIHSILKDNNLSGTQLVAFGDGYVEIELVEELNGYAFGVATDEVRRKGINEHKRQRLLEAGASAIIPDFAEAEAIVAFIKKGAE
ncbi:MAG: SIS domain-containing protein [Oscillospiraceae bacterium]